MLSREYFIKAMTGLCELFEKSPSEFLFEIYWELLKNCDDAELDRAIKQILKTYRYVSLPKPADLLETVIEIRRTKVSTNDESKQLLQLPTPEELAKIHELVQECVRKCEKSTPQPSSGRITK